VPSLLSPGRPRRGEDRPTMVAAGIVGLRGVSPASPAGVARLGWMVVRSRRRRCRGAARDHAPPGHRRRRCSASLGGWHGSGSSPCRRTWRRTTAPAGALSTRTRRRGAPPPTVLDEGLPPKAIGSCSTGLQPSAPVGAGPGASARPYPAPGMPPGWRWKRSGHKSWRPISSRAAVRKSRDRCCHGLSRRPAWPHPA
jgi:hypothetical protein